MTEKFKTIELNPATKLLVLENLKRFKPCVIEHEELSLTQMILEDAQTVWTPLNRDNGHWVDLGYSTDGRLVGIQVWANVARRKNF